MKITLEIEDSHIDDFLKLIQPLSYISKKEGDWYNDLSKAQKESIDIGIKDIALGNLVSDLDVRYEIKKKDRRRHKEMTIIWTYTAQKSYSDIIDFLLIKWNVEVAENLELLVSRTLEKLSVNEYLCPESDFRNLRKCVIHKITSIIYLVKNNTIYIVDIIDNRSNTSY